MNLVARYDIVCPCGETISLLERNLRQIIENLQWSDRRSPQITFLCLHCNTVSRYDYLNRKPAAMIDALPETPVPWRCIVQTGCGNKHCGPPVELVVLEKSETTFEHFQRKIQTFDLTKVFCDKCSESLSVGLGAVTWL